MAQPKPIDLGVNVGDVFLDKYRVEAILGHGGMGVVAKCIHLQLNDWVAIKLLRPDVLVDEDAVLRFEREARAAARLKSEYVAKVTDVGTFGPTKIPYMVMEFLEGNDLDQLIKERGQLPVPWAVELMLQAAEALAEAHSIGIVHRDVKPSNLFVTWRPDGSALIKVLDFGISKSVGNEIELTQTQSLLGTPAYMSPEQMRSARLVDSRTDVWSLGTVMYEIVEGRRPFEADSFSEMCVKVAVDAPAPMTNAPPALQQVILRCLDKVSEQRYQSMAELGRDLIQFAADPHHATLLVERMNRMLRRGLGDLEVASSSGIRERNTPMPMPASMRTPATPMLAVSIAQPDARSAVDLEATAQSPPPAAAKSRKRRIVLWAAIVGIASIAGGAIGKVAIGGSSDEAAPTVAPMKVEVPPLSPTPTPSTPTPVLAGGAPSPGPAPTLPGTAIVEKPAQPAQPQDGDATPAATVAPQPPTMMSPKKPVHPPRIPQKTTPKLKAQEPVIAPPVVPDAPAKPACDPYAIRNTGCGKKP